MPEKQSRYDLLVEVQKFNPYHDARGRFSTSSGAASFTYKPGKSKAHDLAIQRAQAAAKKPAGGEKSKTESKTKKPKSKPKDKPASARPKWMADPGKRNTASQTQHPGGFDSGAENSADRIQKDLRVSTEEAAAMGRAVYNYTSDSGQCSRMRKFAYEGPPPSTAKADADALEAFIAKSPKWNGGTLYRGISVDGKTAQKIVSDAQNGKVLGQRGMSSWTTKTDVADGFSSGGGESHIIFKTSGKQNGTSVKHLSFFDDEDEVLMSNDARWKPTRVSRDPNTGVWTIECEPVA